MRILHYFIGINRAGGLNRYAWDLAVAQAEAGHEISVIYPESTLILPRRACVIQRRTQKGVKVFALRGASPVTLLEGVRSPEMIIKYGRHINADDLRKFCDKLNLDVLHIHTWMGFPVELLDELKLRKVRVVYTTHDYYGLCPKVNFVDWQGNLCSKIDNMACSYCNRCAPGELYLRMRNNPILLRAKRFLRRIAKLLPSENVKAGESQVTEKDYASLRNFYISLLKKCDILHCNSNVSASIYAEFVDVPLQVAAITHNGIKDRRTEKRVDKNKVEIMFSGSSAPFKGLPLLLDVLRELQTQGYNNWHLNVWGCSGNSLTDHISYHGQYSSENQEKVFKANDLLIVPSVCHETFGFVVAEALSFAVPVLCSARVGAKLLLPEQMIFTDRDDLLAKLRNILDNPQILDKLNTGICASPAADDMKKHIGKILDLYKSI